MVENSIRCEELQQLTRPSELTKTIPSRETHLYLPSDTAINGNVIAETHKSWNLTTLQIIVVVIQKRKIDVEREKTESVAHKLSDNRHRVGSGHFRISALFCIDVG